MWVPLLNYEQRQTYMSDIQMSFYLLITIVCILTILEVFFFLKLNRYFLFANLVGSVFIISIGIFKLFNEGEYSNLE